MESSVVMQERTVPRAMVPSVPVPPRSRRLVLIVWLFVAITVFVLVLAIQSMGLLAAGRAYVAGESLWSKGQKEAVFHLYRYALEREDARLRRLRGRHRGAARRPAGAPGARQARARPRRRPRRVSARDATIPTISTA